MRPTTTFCFFNAFYDAHCFLPLLGFLTVDGHPEQHLFSARLRPGIGAGRRGLIPLLRRSIRRLRRVLPGAKILVRLDGGFVQPRLLDALEDLRVQYLLGLPSNLLTRRSKRFLRGLRGSVRKSKAAARRYGSLSYKARKWSRERRVVKAEVLHPPPPSAAPRSTCAMSSRT